MKKTYNFEKAQSNPYARKLKRQISIRISVDVIDYFKQQSRETGIPYQNLVDLYLADCAANHRHLKLQWT